MKRNERERQKVTQNDKFCENLMSLGHCHDQYTCGSRHILSENDRPAPHVPRSGDIKFKIFKPILSPAHYVVQLLAHRSSARSEWEKMPQVDDFFSFQIKFETFYKDVKNQKIHHPIRLGDLCVLEDDNGAFGRCKVIKMEKYKFSEFSHETLTKNKILFRSGTTVQLIDKKNEIHEKLNDTYLLHLHDQFKQFPPQAIDIRIAGIAPIDLNTKWDQNAGKMVRNWFEEYKNCEFHGTIELSLNGCIWVKTIGFVEELSSIQEEALVFDVKKEILKRNLGVANVNSMQRLQDLAQKAGILDAEPVPSSPLPSMLPDHFQEQDKGSGISPLPRILPEHSQERGKGRGRVISGSSNESLQSSKDKSFTNTSSNQPKEQEKPIIQKSATSPTSPTNNACTAIQQWATLIPDEYNEVDLGEFYSPDRVYVLLASEYDR